MKTRNIIVITLVALFILILSITVISMRSSSTAVKAVKLMYNFTNVQELDGNMKNLKDITTSKVYQKLTIDNVERSLNTYLKFKQVSVSVEILQETPDYILYTLHTDALSSGRKFMFTYKKNLLGKISEVKEYEVIPFVEELKK